MSSYRVSAWTSGIDLGTFAESLFDEERSCPVFSYRQVSFEAPQIHNNGTSSAAFLYGT